MLRQEIEIAFILASTRRRAYEYTRFTRSQGGYADGRYPGVTLHFGEFGTDREAYLIFNAEVKKPSGVLRKQNEFLPPTSGGLVKFRKRTVGDFPNRRRSRIWEHMGKLKSYLYQMTIRPDGKGENKSAGLLNIPYEEIKSSVMDEPRTDYERNTDQQRTNFTDVDVPQGQICNGLVRNPIACTVKHELSYQEKKILRKPLSYEEIRNQTTEEWLEDYSRLD